MQKLATSKTITTEQLRASEREEREPLVRVYLLGEFHLVWQAPPATKEALWNARTSARALLKLLLCAPARQAPKSVLAGILWPESEEEKARESLRQASAILRKMLRAADGVELLEQRNAGEILKLAEQSRLWVDADAFEELVAQASRATTAEAAFSVWQEAYALLRGELLSDDQASEWIRHSWVKRRKQGLWFVRCRLIRNLAEAYVQRGQVLLAEELLEQHLVRFPHDQDALYRLLVLLEQQRCYEEASILYEQTKRSLEATGKQPTRQVRAIYERVQKALTPPLPELLVQASVKVPTFATHEREASAFAPVLTPGKTPVEATVIIKKEMPDTPGNIPPLFDAVDGSFNTILRLLEVLFKREETSAMSHLARCQLLELGIAALISQLAQLESRRVTTLERDVLCQVLGESIAESWKLLLSLENTVVVAIGRAQLAVIHQAHTLIYPATRPYFYAGAHSFSGIGLHFQGRDAEALQAYHHGYIASLATGDPWYVAQSLICQADSYHALGQYSTAIQAIEEALRLISVTTAENGTIQRARAHLLSCWADNAMMLQDEHTTQEKLALAEACVERGVSDEKFDRSAWLLIAGKYGLHTGNHAAAKACFEEALAALPEQWVLRRAMTATGLAMAYARMGERASSLASAQELVPLIKATNTPMTNRWFTQYLQQDLRGRFPADSEIRGFVLDTCRQLPPQANMLRTGG